MGPIERRRSGHRHRRGFALIAVIILVALMTTAVALVNEQVVSSLSGAGTVKASEMLKGALETGLDQAIDQALVRDVVQLAEQDYDIFNGAVPIAAGRDFVPAFGYPNSGPYQGAFQVRIGLRPGQRTRPPAGEDVRKAYGQIVELQVSVQAVGTTPPAEERAAVGILIPRVHSN
ncbi:MAG: hypothetical protein IPG45_21200 [Deltaproteobacteria bacterium]|nr:hypothetical protein [Deltaproteobacteria bacterium]